MPFNPKPYARRRAALIAALKKQQNGADFVALIPTAPERTRNRDSDHLYRFDSYFYYLTGFTEPHATLVLSCVKGKAQATLFCQPKDLEREIWDGIRLGVAAAPAALAVDAALSIADLATELPKTLENKAAVYYPFATHDGLDTQVAEWLKPVRAKVRQGVRCPSELRDVCAVLDEMRLVKDAAELQLMRRAAHISASAHLRAMRRCAEGVRNGDDLKGNLREYHLDAELLHEFRRHGSQSVAYGSIVAAGANACILHYRADAAPIQRGDLVLIDAGCELDGYASDITRTFPANGVFSPAQRDLYQLVLASQDAAVAATRPGAAFDAPHHAAVKVLAQGMLDFGLLKKSKHGSLDAVIEKKHYAQFYMHRTGHWLGLDVHDAGAYTDASGKPRKLQAGNVLTIEPGIYVRAESGAPKAFHNIGIRIEDDAVVTATGCELITRAVPVAADAIEAVMRG